MKVSNGKVWAAIGAIGVLLAGCANTDWQKEGGTEQQKVADSSACDAYIAQDDGAVDVNININADARTRAHPKLAAWRQKHIANHASHVHRRTGGSRSNTNNNDAKAEAAAVAAVLVFDAIAVAAERADLHNQCMVALGWSPSQPGSTPVRVASGTPLTKSDESVEQATTPQLMRVLGDPVVGRESEQRATYWQVVPDAPAEGFTCTSTYPRLECF